MAEKQNSSGGKISIAEEGRRRISLTPLSRIIRNQTSTFQRRSANTKSSKLPTGGGFKRFLMKVIVGAGAVYVSAIIGVWGEATESAKIAQEVKDLVRRVGEEKMLSEEFRSDVMSRLNETKAIVKGQMEGIPDTLKTYYEETSQYVNDLIKGKKS